MSGGGVLPKRAPITKDRAKAAVGAGLARLVLAHGQGTVADHAGCSTKTISEAAGARSLPELHTVANLLPLDPTAMDELMAMLGFRIMLIPVDQDDSEYFEMMANAAQLAATLADALRDRRVDHREEQKIEKVLRMILPALNGWMAARDTRKTAV